MAENLIISNNSSKEEKYEVLIPQLKSLVANEKNLVANLANMAAALRETFGWFWVGFYLVDNDELVLGPFQGPIACTRIKYGKGVCGSAWKQAMTLLVPDVEKFPGHIACSSLSVAEIVVPIFDQNQNVIGVLDVDSESYNVLDQIDTVYIEKICKLIDVS